MAEANPPAFESIVTSDKVRGQHLPTRLILIVVGVVLLLALFIGGGVYYMAHYRTQATSKPLTVAERAKLSPSQQIAMAQQYLQQAKTPVAKATAYQSLGSAYVAANQTQHAVAAYQTALVYAPDDIVVLEHLSGEYEDANDKVNTVKTLQALVSALHASNLSEKNYLLSRYEAELRYWQGKS